MLFNSLQKDDYIVQVEESQLPVHRGQDSFHCPSDGGERVLHSKWHPYKLVQTIMTGKGGLFTATFVDFDLLIAAVRI